MVYSLSDCYPHMIQANLSSDMQDFFWNIIEQAKSLAENDIEQRPVALKQILMGQTAEQIQRFEQIYREKLLEAYRWELWGAAYVIQGGCSDDSFDYFRDFLISEGQQIFAQALKSPDDLAHIDLPDDVELEDFRYAIGDAYEAVTGQGLPVNTVSFPAEPAGQAWTEDQLNALYPQLCAKYD